MKTVSIFATVFFLCLFANQVQAQDLTSMLTDIADGIKPEAFTKDFSKNKSDWSEAVGNMDANDMSAVSGQVGSLLKGLKGSAFQKGAHTKLLGQLAQMGSLSDVGNLLTGLVNGLKPSMLTGALANNKASVLEGLADL